MENGIGYSTLKIFMTLASGWLYIWLLNQQHQNTDNDYFVNFWIQLRIFTVEPVKAGTAAEGINGARVKKVNNATAAAK